MLPQHSAPAQRRLARAASGIASASTPWGPVRRRTRSASGLTLVELLVALALMAVLALMSWRALDAMVRTDDHSRSHAHAWLQWQSVLSQWQTDLDQMHPSGLLPPVTFDGQVLRIVRPEANPPPGQPPALVVVAWALQPATATAGTPRQWSRWVSVPVTQQQDLHSAWISAQQWGLSPTPALQRQALVLAEVQDWQLFYHRAGRWGPALDANLAPAQRPDGIRLRLVLPEGQIVGGSLNLDWVHPSVGGGKTP